MRSVSAEHSIGRSQGSRDTNRDCFLPCPEMNGAANQTFFPPDGQLLFGHAYQQHRIQI
jgi:hypothetical protein